MSVQVAELIRQLKKDLFNHNQVMEVKDEGAVYKVSCTFNSPATENQIQSFEEKTGLKLPEAYKEFLLVTNGCRLFDSLEFGGENDVYSLEDILNYTYETPYQGRVKVACIYQENIVIDTEAAREGRSDYMMVKGHIDDFEEARPLDMDFGEWLEAFIAHHGRKFWARQKN